MDEKEGKTLISESSVGRLYVYWEEYKSNLYLHVRYWFKDKRDMTWKPGPKGVAIPESKVPDLLGGLRTVITQRIEPAVGNG